MIYMFFIKEENFCKKNFYLKTGLVDNLKNFELEIKLNVLK